ncbi:hypothetical protein M3Y98_01030500 [Aphelenchoides besseyi]|nr:hypothetical protein M3Y98_01030500 [Aphelenchoides besseyi]KAI6209978.1 hypothetical protein M3Y96_00278200 [Aphelenchoides besseyi]
MTVGKTHIYRLETDEVPEDKHCVWIKKLLVIILLLVLLSFLAFCFVHRWHENKIVVKIEKLNGTYFALKISDRKTVAEVMEIVKQKEGTKSIRLYFNDKLLDPNRTLKSYRLHDIQLRTEDEIRIKIIIHRRGYQNGGLYFGGRLTTRIAQLKSAIEKKFNRTATLFINELELEEMDKTFKDYAVIEGSRVDAVLEQSERLSPLHKPMDSKYYLASSNGSAYE